MALFHYQASDIHGRKRRGVLEADSARHARQLLREQALIPVRLEEKQLHHQHSPRSILRFRPRGVSSAELALLTRQLSTLVAASLPLEEALDALSRQSEKPRQRDLIAAVRARVLEGHSLATAMGMFLVRLSVFIVRWWRRVKHPVAWMWYLVVWLTIPSNARSCETVCSVH